MKSFRLFERRENRAIVLRQRAEELYSQLRTAQSPKSLSGTPLRGQHSQRQGGPGHDFWQYRDFQSGDHSRTIDWKQSGKTDRILIRQKEKETQKRTSIWLQNDASMNFSSNRHAITKYECGAILTLVAAMLCAERHDPLRLSGVGALSLDDLTHILDEGHFVPSAEDLGGHEIFLIGDFLSRVPDLMQTLFDTIPGHKRVHLIQILDPAELDLPYDGRTVFEHPAGTDSEQILNVATIGDNYMKRLGDHIEAIRHEALSRHWSYTLIRSDQNLFDPLLDIILHGGD